MKKRLANIELLRIISMLMIIELHLLVFTNTLDTYNTFSSKSFFIWFIESLCFVSVNCYVLISGYFLVHSKFKFKKLFTIWIEVLFYSVAIYFVLLLTHRISFTFSAFFKSIFPFLLKNYWFVTVYLMLYILSPILNKLINSLNKKQYIYLICIIFIFFSFWGTIIPQANTINYGGGYSISWFVCLYIIAGYLRNYCSDKPIKKSICILIYFVASVLNVLGYFIVKKLEISFVIPDFLYYYYSITVLIASISLFMLFKSINIKNTLSNKIINFFAPTTFGIYLIHENPNLRDLLWQNFYFVKDYSGLKIVCLIICIPISLFIIFSLIDKLRTVLFNILAKLNINKKSLSFKYLEKLEDILCQK